MSVRYAKALVLTLTATLLNPVLKGQQAVVLDPLAQATTALIDAGVSLQDITLKGSVEHKVGSIDELGTITMMALADGSSRYDVTLPDRAFAESVFVTDSRWQGNRRETTRGVEKIAPHNLMIDAAWYCPALLLQNYGLSDPSRNVISLGSVQRHGGQFVQIESAKQRHSGFSTTDKEIARLSLADLFLDPTTFRPAILTFTTHLDTDSRINIPVEVRYSEYKSFAGVLVPQHIQHYVKGSLDIDIHLNSVQVNSGLLSSQFPL